MKRSKVNWHESARLVAHKAPGEPISPAGVSPYLDAVEDYARAVLRDLGVADPVVPLPTDDRRRLYDAEYHEQSADSVLAVRLLENAGILKTLRAIESPNADQVNFMLMLMAQISADTSMPHFRVPMLLRGKLEQQRAERARNEEIRYRRADGWTTAALAKEYDLDERRIKRIVKRK